MYMCSRVRRDAHYTNALRACVCVHARSHTCMCCILATLDVVMLLQIEKPYKVYTQCITRLKCGITRVQPFKSSSVLMCAAVCILHVCHTQRQDTFDTCNTTRGQHLQSYSVLMCAAVCTLLKCTARLKRVIPRV